jgi:hypothetical protein
VAITPTVVLADQRGHGIANVWVRWTVANGSGSATNDSSRTDASGLATSGGWALGTVAGTQTLTASASGLPAIIFTAQAAAGPVQSLMPINDAQTGLVNTVLANPPSVRAVDQYGNAVAGLVVTFAITSGGGTLTGAQQTTKSDGVATATSWKLGTVAGDQTVSAVLASSAVMTTLTAHVVGSVPTQMVLYEGDAQTGSAERRLCVSPSVRLLDIYGNGVAQVPVLFTPAAGSGSVTNNTVSSDTSGEAEVGAWSLGSGAVQTLTATSSMLPGKSVIFTATVTAPSSGYSICARFLGSGGTPRQREAVAKAVARWQSVIVGHVQTTHLTAPARQCSVDVPTPAIDEEVEDLLLFVHLAPIDGPRNVIGQAAPCYVHLPAVLTLMGFLQLDLADLDLMLSDGTLDNVVLHEIGHILGIGTLWNQDPRALLNGFGSDDPYFLGAVAREQFALTGTTYDGTPVPVENVGQPGTRDAHWRKSIFGNELMQGFSAPVMPLSKVTIGSLADLGYQVNLDAADAFSLRPSLRVFGTAHDQEMTEDVADTPIWGVEKNGTHRVVRTPRNPFKR